MVVDTSALVAALSGETEAAFVLDALAADPEPILSAGTLLEASLVMQARYGDEGVRDLHLLLHAAEATVVPVARDQVDVAVEGFRRFGKGRHVAGLNYGDLFAYGLASLRAEPLLCVGDDFAKTGVAAVPAGPA
jgi:ribonuclease VapC